MVCHGSLEPQKSSEKGAKKVMPRRLQLFFLLSLLLHLGGFFVVDLLEVDPEEDPIFRARLTYQPRFTPPPRLPAPRYDLPQVDLEYAPVQAVPQQIGATAVATPENQPLEVEPVRPEPTQLAGLPVPKAAAPQLERQAMPSPTAPTRRDTAATEGLDLLRVEDMARADARRAVVVPDLYSRRDISGYVNLTYLRLDGAGGFSLEGKPILEDIARYVRDSTQILAQMRSKYFNLFLDDELLEDPVHFLFPIERTAPIYPHKRIYWRPDEIARMEKYLRGGGFLFIDAGNSSDDRWFLREMIALLRQTLAGDGHLQEVSWGHSVYHSFYDYPAGFPDERPKRSLAGLGNDWYYPDLAPCSKRLRGLWSLELDGRTAAVISDLDLHLKASGITTDCAQQEGREAAGDTTSVAPLPEGPYLQAMTNVLVYALTRPSGLALLQDRPKWSPQRPAHVDPLLAAVEPEPDWPQQELAGVLDAALALVHTPLGENIGRGGLGIYVDGRYRLEVLAQEANGLMVRNLPAGPHWLRVEFAGKSQEVEVDLQGGKVTTVAFRMDRLAFFSRLSLRPQAEQVEVGDWQGRFGDLRIEEVFYEEEMGVP